MIDVICCKKYIFSLAKELAREGRRNVRYANTGNMFRRCPAIHGQWARVSCHVRLVVTAFV